MMETIMKVFIWFKCKNGNHNYDFRFTPEEFVGWGYENCKIGICKHCGYELRISQFRKTRNFYDVYPQPTSSSKDDSKVVKEDRVGGIYGILHSFYY